ncbi:hypothetical protein LO749_20830 [Paracoccus denitrificans]|uniref:hypothetical protein n=1 Tax=Paracoccus denitrificans TaxID=266 RepID=UPI001E52FBE7|nr:hypothetical protein [Paracoccus denitrificans]UFS66940.1 hypothetical protein LO749_20830 [Paracoccus denitrificans]
MEHVKEIETGLRAEDRRELEDIAGRPAIQSLLMGALCGEPCLSLWSHGGEPLALLTIIRTGLDRGTIALSGTAAIERFSIPFLRGSRDVLRRVQGDYSLLYNVCDARNEVHRRWLRWLGFNELREVPGYGAGKIPVIEFAGLRRQDHL